MARTSPAHSDWRFLFNLAEHLHMTVTEMLTKMPAWELTEWVGYFRVRQQEQELEQGRQSYG